MTTDSFPYTYKFQADRLGSAEKAVLVEPDPAACERIARAYDCVAVDNLRADLTVKPWRKAGVRVVGKISAILTQKCVVTLEDFQQDLVDEIDRTFEPASSRPRRARDINEDGEIEIDLETLDPPDVMLDGVIDLGAVICEQLALNIDPFPRKEGAEFSHMEEEPGEAEDEQPSAFAELAKLKQDKNH